MKKNTKIFCDIAELAIIKKFNKKNIVKGFTTNPSSTTMRHEQMASLG